MGVGRQIGVKAWIRADYRREQRSSNVPGFDVTNDGFLIQLGIGRLGPGDPGSMTAALLLAFLVIPLAGAHAPQADASTAAERGTDSMVAPAQAEEIPAGQVEPEPAEGVRVEYEVGPGDVLELEVIGNDDLSRLPTVQTNGAILLPLLGEVQVAGLTVAEIQRKVTNLLEKDYLVNPQVVVKVTQYQSQYVSVVGEVNSPGRKPLRGRTRLIDVLVEAGGFTPRASGEVVITRSDGTFPGGRAEAGRSSRRVGRPPRRIRSTSSCRCATATSSPLRPSST